LCFVKRFHPVALNGSNVILKFLVANETIIFPAGLPVIMPLLTGLAFCALPTELNLLPFDRTRDERTTDGHTVCAFAPTAFALPLCVVTWTQSA
jgi:hypothetical protein